MRADIMADIGGVRMALQDGGPSTTLAAGSAPGESGVSLLSVRFGIHLLATSRCHCICFQMSPGQQAAYGRSRLGTRAHGTLGIGVQHLGASSWGDRVARSRGQLYRRLRGVYTVVVAQTACQRKAASDCGSEGLQSLGQISAPRACATPASGEHLLTPTPGETAVWSFPNLRATAGDFGATFRRLRC